MVHIKHCLTYSSFLYFVPHNTATDPYSHEAPSVAIQAPKKWAGGTLGPRQIEVGPLKTVFERKRVS